MGKRYNYFQAISNKSLLLNFLTKANLFKPFIKQQPEIEEKLFFILGSGRNGSTLLSIMLNNNPEIFLPKEQYTLPYTIAKYQLNFISNLEKKINVIIRDFESHSQDWHFNQNTKADIISELLNTKIHGLSIQQIYYSIIKNFAIQNGQKSSLFGDHTPVLVNNFDIVYQNFKKSKYILLVRDPLDVVTSCLKIDYLADFSSLKVASRWNLGVDNFFKHTNSKNFSHHIVRYEDLVADTKTTINSICTFLGVEYTDEMLNTLSDKNPLRKFNLNLKHHQNLNKPISTASIGKWKKELSKEKIDEILPVVIDNAKRFGYTY